MSELRRCSRCREPYDWIAFDGTLRGYCCMGCGRDFTHELTDRYLELLDAFPDQPSDLLASHAAQDYNADVLAALVARYP